MRQKSGNPRTERVLVLYSADEFSRLKKLFARSTGKTLSNYVRNVSLQEPVEVVQRNQSFDDFVVELVLLRKELASIRQLPLTPEKMQQITRLHEEIRNKTYQIADLCMR
ncbi:MAG: hypothetical protein JST42_22525 [Bacteroidetes bacterium]|nr:hypothetical protein [Bacteroidota bacterium]